MGLDMYLTAGFNFNRFESSSKDCKDKFDAVIDLLGFTRLPDQINPMVQINVNIGYWRKANQIHNWFVQHVQEGEDNCSRYYVSREKLQELLDLCVEVLKLRGTPEEEEKAKELLPPVSGFFFGGTAINEGYWEDVQYTHDTLRNICGNRALENADFFYQSSW